MKKINYRKIKQGFSLILILLMTFTMVGCSTVGASFKNFKDKYFPEEKPDTIKIAIYEPMTGEFSSQGKLEINGIELAHDTKPQILGKDVELVYLDNKSDMYEGEEVLNNILTTDFAGVIGSYGDVLTLVCGKRVKELKIPAMATTCVNNLLTINNPYYFTTSYNEDNQGGVLGSYASNSINSKSIAIVRIAKDETQESIIDGFKEELAKNSDTKVIEITVDLEQTSYKDEVAEMKRKGVDTVLILLPLKSAQDLMGQCKEIAYLPEFLGTRTFDNPDMITYIENNGYNCSYCSDIVASDDNLDKSFDKAYSDKYGSEPENTSAAISYDAYMILTTAIEKAFLSTANMSGDSVREAILSLSNYNGVSGYITYEGTNVASKPIDVKRIAAKEAIKTETDTSIIVDANSNNEGEK